MKKVAKSKKQPKVEDESKVVTEEKKASSLPKRMGSEIDEIFAGKKRRRLENEKGEDEKAGKVEKKKGKRSSKSRSYDQSCSAERPRHPKKKTADGLPIFTEEELGIGKADAGGTALCPFDCDCCF